MSRWRGRIDQLIGLGDHEDEAETSPSPTEYAYTLYWARQVQGWGPEQRKSIAAEVETIVSGVGFRPNENFRIYTVPGLDKSAHAGASLVALKLTLMAFERIDREGDFDD
jgi:hypothetical protein